MDLSFPLPAEAGADFVCLVYGFGVLAHGSGEHRWRYGGELGEAPEVLHGRRQQELVLGAGEAAQPEPRQRQVALHVRCWL